MNERGHIRDAKMIEIHMMTGTHLTGEDTRMMKTLDDPVVVATARSEEDTNVTTTKSGKIDAMVETEEVVLLRVGRPPRPNEPWGPGRVHVPRVLGRARVPHLMSPRKTRTRGNRTSINRDFLQRRPTRSA